jgi:drug/metabolite transporter (DMT)-like permease
MLPLMLFFGSGLLDTMIKYVEQIFLNESNNNSYLITAFLAAASVGTIILGILVLQKKQRLSWKAVVAGIAIGVPNYFSIWCLIKVLKDYGTNSSAIIPINNMGIVLFSAVVAFIFFREKLSLLNWMGIVLSLVAIALIAFG